MQDRIGKCSRDDEIIKALNAANANFRAESTSQVAANKKSVPLHPSEISIDLDR